MRSCLPSCVLFAGAAVCAGLAPSLAKADPPDAPGASSASPFAPLPSAPLRSASPPPASTASAPAAASTTPSPTPRADVYPSFSRQAGDPLEPGQHFTIDPVSDGVITAAGFGFAGILGLVLSTGEIQPTPPPKNPTTGLPDDSILISIDRGAVSQTFDPNANTFSDIGLYSAIGFTLVDTVMSGIRDGWDAGLVDAVMYAESLSLTLTITDITKIAVRRPRPFDYKNPDSTTNSDLSFFSGHASTLGAITGTATYLAFVRSPHSVRPWITLIVGTALTAFVSYERVRGGDHFPTDVITGAMAGGAIGVLVPHLHRHKTEAPNVWIGAVPVPGAEGGTLSLQGLF
jgi:membrane-associated phospholipid phosphatase